MSRSNRAIYSPSAVSPYTGRGLYSPTSGRHLYSGPAWLGAEQIDFFNSPLAYGSPWDATHFAQTQTDCRSEITNTALGYNWQSGSTGTTLDSMGYTSYGTLCFSDWCFKVFRYSIPAGLRGIITAVRFRARGYGATRWNPPGNSSYETGPFRGWAASDFGTSLNMVIVPTVIPYPIQNSGVLMGTTPTLSIPFSAMNATNVAAGYSVSSLVAPPITDFTSCVDATALKNLFNGLSGDSFLMYTSIPWPAGGFPYLAGPAANCANDFDELVFFNTPQFLLSP